jgi:acyl-ACP thioesterase
MERQSIWGEEFRVRSYEVDPHHAIKLPVLCNYLQEIAWHHARHLGFGYFDLIERNQLWVMSRLVVEITSIPHWDDTIQLETWAKGTERFFALRDFRATNSRGDELINATSFWLLLDGEKKRPVRLDRFQDEVPLETKKHALEESFRKGEELEAGEIADQRLVRYGELDQNNHVNYVQFISWIVDSYSRQFVSEHMIRRFEINYIAEALYEDALTVLRQGQDNNPGTYLHSVVREKTGEELCRARAAWKMRTP